MTRVAALRETSAVATEATPTRDHERRFGAPHDRGRIYREHPRRREVYLYGDRVKDVTTHPAFRNSVRMTARLYNALHDQKTRDVLNLPDGHRHGGYIPCGSFVLRARQRT